jgi:hypothetical protein
MVKYGVRKTKLVFIGVKKLRYKNKGGSKERSKEEGR